MLRKSTILKSALLGSVAMFMASCASTVDMDGPNGIQMVEQSKAKKGEISIPYKKYVLENGLTVILHQDKSDPLVHVDVTYHVGSGREELGNSGFAHFFEHMMFQGSQHVGDDQHFKIISASGGTLNGTTNTDRTNYYETVPSNQLEKMLWLEADRMGFMLPAVTQEKFEVQRETVKNERGQNYDNRPYGLLRERVNEALYPEGHPYSWLTIGYIDDLNRVNVNDLKKFFLRWYGPNNATLTIGGDLDEAQTLAWIEKYFGSIPRGPEVTKPVIEKVTLDETRYISMEDNVSLPLVYMSYPTVHARHADEAPLDVLMEILGSGRTSLLYKNLVKEGLAVQASAGHGCAELSCTFTMLALPNPAKGTSLTDLEQTMRDSLVEFESRGVTDDDLVKIKAGIVSGMIYGLESVSGKVSQLAAYETFENDPSYISKDVSRYENVTKEDVMRVYNTYIKDKPSVVMSIMPKGKGMKPAQADNFTPPVRNFTEVSTTTADDLVLREATDNFDRSVMPGEGANPMVSVPAIWESNLSNGIEILGSVNSEVPTTTISFRIGKGQRNESLSQLGLASMTASMMNEATTKSTNEELSNALDKLGSSVSISSGDLYTTLSIRTLTENLDATLAIANEKLMHPKFDQADFDRVKDQTIQGIESSKKDAASVASSVLDKKLYGTDNAFAYSGAGTIDTVKSLTLDDVKSFYAAQYSPKAASIIVVSDLNKSAIKRKLSVFDDWTGDDIADAAVNPFPTLDAGTMYIIDKEGAAQSQIRIAKRTGMAYDVDGEYYRSNIMNYTLGGAFNSRINMHLREDKGYSYGAYSYFTSGKITNAFISGAGVRSNITDKAVVEFLKEIKNYHENGITAEELAFTKSSIGQSDARRYETPRQKAGFISGILTYDLPHNYTDTQSEILENVTQTELNTLAAKHLNVDDMIMVIVGDKASIEPGLAELGWNIVELDVDGNVK